MSTDVRLPFDCLRARTDELRGAIVSAAIAALSANSHALDIGVNVNAASVHVANNDQIAAVMKQRNLKTVRLNLFPDMDIAPFRDLVQKIRANGGTAEVTLQVSHQWDHSCNQNLAWVEQRAYDESVIAINKVRDIVHDFEMLNETQLRPEIQREVPWNSAGGATAPYEGKACVNNLTAALKGMSRAIRDVRTSSGLPLRSMLGVLGRDFGFLKYMQSKGVQFDVVGYHFYPRNDHPTGSMGTDPWFGPGGVFVQLAQFSKPVHWNEFNCGEIYDSNYDNVQGSATSETCLKALAKHLTDLRRQKIVNLEFVHIYELLDEPKKAIPENRFGLMYDLSRPKAHLYLISALAGGALSSQERIEITRRRLLTDAEIDAMRVAAPAPAPASSPAPAPAPATAR